MLPRPSTAPCNFLVFLLVLLFTTSYLYKARSSMAPPNTEPPPDPTTPTNTTTTEMVTTTILPKRVWDTMDGEGYQFLDTQGPVELDPRFEQLDQLPPCDDDSFGEEVQQKMENIKTNFLACILPIVQQWKNRAHEMNTEWVKKVKVCDELPVFQSMKIVPIPNLHEIKWTILPKCKEPNVLVTLGIGHDTVAEETLNRTLPNTMFYGADPIIEPNRRMYSAFGKFFPFAVGRTPGFSKFRVLPNQNQRTKNYVNEDVITVDIIYFLKEMLKLQKIDFAWIDMEGGEFELLDLLHRNGTLDNAAISICQFNLEVHSKFRSEAEGAQIFHDFIFKVLEEGRYVFANSLHTDVGVHRMFFVNVEDRQCLAKYFSDL